VRLTLVGDGKRRMSVPSERRLLWRLESKRFAVKLPEAAATLARVSCRLRWG